MGNLLDQASYSVIAARLQPLSCAERLVFATSLRFLVCLSVCVCVCLSVCLSVCPHKWNSIYLEIPFILFAQMKFHLCGQFFFHPQFFWPPFFFYPQNFFHPNFFFTPNFFITPFFLPPFFSLPHFFFTPIFFFAPNFFVHPNFFFHQFFFTPIFLPPKFFSLHHIFTRSHLALAAKYSAARCSYPNPPPFQLGVRGRSSTNLLHPHFFRPAFHP